MLPARLNWPGIETSLHELVPEEVPLGAESASKERARVDRKDACIGKRGK
jgi:hypothetical protein